MKTITAKLDAGKTRPTLVPASLINAVTAVQEYETKKYSDPDHWRNAEARKDPDNWRTMEVQRYRDELHYHWFAYLGGVGSDSESGLPHLWHMVYNVARLIELDQQTNM